MPLFKKVDFIGAAGKPLTWRIECDALTDEDWQAIADICGPKLPAFNRVIPVPRGGVKLAWYMTKYQSNHGVALFVDDVWTTGHSMTKLVKELGFGQWIGFVTFKRGLACGNTVFSFMQAEPWLND